MPNPHQALLNELARLRGLGEAYYDHRGILHRFTDEPRRAILRAMELPTDDESALRAALAASAPLARASESSNSATCYQPPVLSKTKCWGLSIQLYTLRSKRNWGIGDFADLRELIDLVAPIGCDLIGLNPLHALFSANPRLCSPYSPSSRLFLNPLYISIEAIPEFAGCAAVQSFCSQSSIQAALAGLRVLDNVMYEQVASLKRSALRLLHDHFRETQLALDSPRASAFRQFVASGGEALRLHCVFEALDAKFGERDLKGWRRWPIEFREPHSNSVREFAIANDADIEFHLYTQWLARQQLEDVQQLARDKGMRIGLYGDLAVGANPGGSEIWSNQSLYVQAASVGAPPDPLALKGQDWGIPPMDPHQLRLQQFGPFVELLRANLQHVGALRIDHVMSLFRLWWVPKGFSAVDGVYVHYPLEELAQRLAVESTRAKCLIVGEDLGTVPDEVRNAMGTHQLYQYKVLLFERRDDRTFKAPDEYARLAIATATTHDLPPLKAWWQGDDIWSRDRLGLFADVAVVKHLRDERAADRHALLTALNDAGLWNWRTNDSLPEFSPALARAMHLYLARSTAALVLIQLEDLLGMTEPVNVPGTDTEHANWQRKLTGTTRDIFTNAEILESLSAVNTARIAND